MYEGIYAIYKKQSKDKCQIAFLIDQIPNSWRRSAVLNNYNIIYKRPLSKIEIEECEANKEFNNKRFIVWYYKDLEYLIKEDLKYGIKTPKEAIIAFESYLKQAS